MLNTERIQVTCDAKPGGPAGAAPQTLSMVERGLKGTLGASLAERMGSVGGKKLPSYHSKISTRVKGPCNTSQIAMSGSYLTRPDRLTRPDQSDQLTKNNYKILQRHIRQRSSEGELDE